MAFTPSKVIRCYGTGALSGASTKTDTTNKYVQHGRFRAAGASTPTNYVSLAVFDDFSEDFTKNSITEISISFTAAGGYHTNHDNATKTLEFYFGYTETTFKNLYNLKNAATGVIKHTFKQNPNKATFNITITNSASLTLFENAFSKGIKTIAFYSATDYHDGNMSSNTQSNQGWSMNYVQISNLTLEVQTRPRGATIKSLSSSVELNKNCSITIEPLSGSYTYRAYCQLGSKKTDLQSPINNIFTISIPEDWGSEILTSTTGTGTAIVETLSGTQVIGTTSKNFNITIPDYSSSNFGTIKCSFETCYALDSSGNINGEKFFLIGYSRACVQGVLKEHYGAPLKQIELSYGSVTKPLSKDFSEKIIMPDRSTILKILVTDSRGISYTYTFNPGNTTTNYQTGTAPTLSNFSVARCDKNGDFSSSGSYIRVTGNLSSNAKLGVAFINDNEQGVKIELNAKESNSWYGGSSNSPFSSDAEYRLTLQAISTKYVDSDTKSPIFTGYSAILPSGSFLLHFSNAGNSIGIGGAAEPPESDQNGKITMNWPVKFKDGFYLPKTNEANAEYQQVKSISDLGGSNSLPDSTTSLTVTNLTVTNPIKYQTYNDISFYPMKIVTSLPGSGTANVIYFVKSST